MIVLFGLLMVLGAIIAVIVVASILASLFAVGVAVAPVHKVPIRYNLRNMQVRWKTSLVTALAFTIVVGLLTVMLAFVKGMDRLTQDSGVPGNVLVLADGATDEAWSNLPPASVRQLPDDLQRMIEKNQNGDFLATQEVFVICTHMIPNPNPGGRKRRFVQMRGLDNVLIAADVHQIELESGEWFSDAGVREVTRNHNGSSIKDTALEVVLGNGIARTFGADVGKDSLGPGDIVQIGPRFWYITGVMKASNSAFGSELWTKDRSVQELFGRANSYNSYVVRTKSEEIAEQASKLLSQFRSERAMKAQTERQYYSNLTATNDQFRYAILFVAIIMAVGGVLGVMNTMFAAISQRTKDIGVLRLLGFRRWQILASFLLESLVLAFVGGALGMLVAYLLFDGATANSIVSSGPGGGKSIVLRLTVDGSVLLWGLVFTFVMGAVGGLIPSLSAMRLKPLESLK
ncbi:MAG: ABC transporter permease [Gemmataceae bacterium]|nr:ABC transporter permease [Gemmataceae bacterium]MCI0742750.1 ABC transporter permease [Gemmataceae bacterium]